MNVQHLIQMANRIGEFFQAMPDHTEALEGIANHIQKFWEPRMRSRLAEHLAQGGEGLLPIVREALDSHPALLA